MKLFFFLILLFISGISFAQTDTTKGKEEVHITADVMPEFKGGLPKMMEFIQKNINYPKAEKKANITGTCYVGFVVEKDGSISNVRILRGVLNGPGCDKEAMRVVSSMPDWIPGIYKGEKVRVQFNLPIKYSLRDPK